MSLREDADGLISQFRGIAFAKSRSRKRDTKGEPVRAGVIGVKAFERLNIAPESPREVLNQNWDRIVEQKYAAKCAPTTIRMGTLTIKAESSALKQQLLFEQKGILKRVQNYPGCEKILKLKII